MNEFEKLLNENLTAVKRYIIFKVSDSADAEDILQDVLLAAYKSYSGLKNKEAFKSWLMSISRNKCNDYFRKKAKILEIPIDDLISDELIQTRFGYTEYSTVTDTLESLGDKDKQILYLAYWKDMPLSQIAEALDIPVGTVKSRLHRARQNFKEKYN